MDFIKILILIILVVILYSYFNCKKEGYANGEEVNVCPVIGNESTMLSLPDDLDGKFIDIDARDKYFLYAVSDSNEIYRCKKPCSDTTDGSVLWEKYPVMNISGYDINKIYASPNGDFLWGLNELGDPVYTFQENNEILRDFRERLIQPSDADLNSYEEKGSGYCKNNKIIVDSLQNILESQESLDACKTECNNHENCAFISYSNSLKICNLYRNNAQNGCEIPGQLYSNDSFTTYKRNRIDVAGEQADVEVSREESRADAAEQSRLASATQEQEQAKAQQE